MNPRTTQVNFSRGELAPQLYGRFDVDAYSAALKLARNVIVLKYGGVTKRPGTRLVGEVLDQTNDCRLIPFQFSLEQTYALEFGQGYMSPCAQGGRLTEEELAITGITNAVEAVVEVAYHALAVDDLFFITGVAGELGDLLNGRAWLVTEIVDANHFKIAADTTGLAAFTTATGGITRVGAPTVPTPPTVPPPYTGPAFPSGYYGSGGYWTKFGDLLDFGF